MTPAALTMRYLRRAGYLVDVVERWIPGANIRRDLFGIVDLLAAHLVFSKAIQTEGRPVERWFLVTKLTT